MKIPQLTFTRFLAAAAIVIFHSALHLPLFKHGVIHTLFDLASSLVSYFFVLSGFIMIITNYKDGNWPENINKKIYWWNRFTRIYPVYFISLLLFVLIYLLIYSWEGLYRLIPEAIQNLLLVQAWNYKVTTDMNFPAWSLSVELFFYLLFPFLYVGLIKRSSFLLIILSLCLWLGNTYVFYLFDVNEAPRQLYYANPLLHLATFVIGVCAGILYVRHYHLLQQKKSYVYSVFLIFFFFFIYYGGRESLLFRYHHNGMLSPLYVATIYSLALLNKFPKRVLSNKVLVYLGNISYGLYILQTPVKYLFEYKLAGLSISNPEHFFCLYCLGLFIITIVVYHLIEIPVQKYLREYIRIK